MSSPRENATAWQSISTVSHVRFIPLSYWKQKARKKIRSLKTIPKNMIQLFWQKFKKIVSVE